MRFGLKGRRSEKRLASDVSDMGPEMRSVACQTIAHRGCPTNNPENTMAAFRQAVAENTNAIETDIHLTQDGVVVLSHDPNLKRCYGVDQNISSCDYSYIRTLRTIKAPHEHMPTLKELLEYMVQPGLENLWLLLDIKLDNHPDDVIRLISETVFAVKPSSEFWKDRIRMGVWSFNYVEICKKYLPSFQVTFIGFSVDMAQPFLSIPNVSLNMADIALCTDSGIRLIDDAQARGIKVFMWTVNEMEMMKWALYHNLDGVCTDHPAKFRRFAENYRGEQPCIGFKKRLAMLTFRILIKLFDLWRPMEERIDQKMNWKKPRIRDRLIAEEERALLDE